MKLESVVLLLCVIVYDVLKWNLYNEWWVIEGNVVLWFIFWKGYVEYILILLIYVMIYMKKDYLNL